MSAVSRPRHCRLIGGAVAGIQATSRITAIVATLIIFAVLATTLADIVLRNTIGQAIPGVFEYSEIALVPIVFLGVPYTMQVGGHVAIESLTSRLPSVWRRYVEAAALAVTLPFVLWLTIASVGAAIDSYISHEVRFGVVQAPVWPARVAIPVGAGLLAGEISIAIGRQLRDGRQAERTDSRPSDLV